MSPMSSRHLPFASRRRRSLSPARGVDTLGRSPRSSIPADRRGPGAGGVEGAGGRDGEEPRRRVRAPVHRGAPAAERVARRPARRADRLRPRRACTARWTSPRRGSAVRHPPPSASSSPARRPRRARARAEDVANRVVAWASQQAKAQRKQSAEALKAQLAAVPVGELDGRAREAARRGEAAAARAVAARTRRRPGK